MTGHIEYSLPKVPYGEFEAYVKMRNDPKFVVASVENLLVKGSV